MARLNEILVGRFARYFQKHFGLKGPVPVATLGPEIMPTVPVYTGVENLFLQAWNRYGVGFTQAGVAAQNSAIRFRNPKASQIVAVLERVVIFEPAADTVQIQNQMADADLVGAVRGNGLDGRQIRTASNSVCSVSGTNNLGVLGAFVGACHLQANIDYLLFQFEEQEVAILPGDNWTFFTGNVNQVVAIELFWRERFLEEPEQLST